jgi:glycerate kinase
MARRPHARVLAAPDRFGEQATAGELAAAVARACRSQGWECDEAPVADGGQGTLEVLGGAARQTTVRGALGEPVVAQWNLRDDGSAVVEMARASGLELVGGPEANDPLRATSYGTGELVAAALAAGARRVVVCLGGSASTDGGLGAVSALRAHRLVPLGPVEVVVACDVATLFLDAAEQFAPPKGASPAEVSLLRRRLERLADVYRRDHGVDVEALPGSGAGGGLAGGLAAVGATLVPGFDLVAEELDLESRIAGLADEPRADLVVTGEERIDAETFAGRAAGGVAMLAARARVPVLFVAGEVDPGAGPPAWLGAGLRVVPLLERYDPASLAADAGRCVEAVVAEHLAGRRGDPHR